ADPERGSCPASCTPGGSRWEAWAAARASFPPRAASRAGSPSARRLSTPSSAGSWCSPPRSQSGLRPRLASCFLQAHTLEKDIRDLAAEVGQPIALGTKEVGGTDHADEELGADARVDAAQLAPLDALEDRLLREPHDCLAALEQLVLPRGVLIVVLE